MSGEWFNGKECPEAAAAREEDPNMFLLALIRSHEFNMETHVRKCFPAADAWSTVNIERGGLHMYFTSFILLFALL